MNLHIYNLLTDFIAVKVKSLKENSDECVDGWSFAMYRSLDTLYKKFKKHRSIFY